MKKKYVSLWNLHYDDRELINCRDCGTSNNVWHFTDIDEYYCEDCANEELEEIETEESYNQKCAERNK